MGNFYLNSQSRIVLDYLEVMYRLQFVQFVYSKNGLLVNNVSKEKQFCGSVWVI